MTITGEVGLAHARPTMLSISSHHGQSKFIALPFRDGINIQKVRKSTILIAERALTLAPGSITYFSSPDRRTHFVRVSSLYMAGFVRTATSVPHKNMSASSVVHVFTFIIVACHAYNPHSTLGAPPTHFRP